MRRAILLLFLPVFLFAQTAKFPTAVAADKDVTRQKDKAQSTLTGALNASATSFTVVTGSKFIAGMVVSIDNEQLMICDVTGNTVTVGYSACPNIDGRGYANTSAASHVNGSLVSGNIVAWNHNSLAAEVQAIETALGANLSAVDAAIAAAIGTIPAVPNPLPINKGGTNAQTAADARTSLSAAKSGANNDITSLSALSTPLSAAQGGTNASGFTAGSVTFGAASGSGLTQDASNLSWDDADNRLNVRKTSAPQGAVWIGPGDLNWGVFGSTYNAGALASSITQAVNPTVTSSINHIFTASDNKAYFQSCSGTWAALNGGPYTVTSTGLTTFTIAGVDTSGYGVYPGDCVWAYRNDIKATTDGLVIADGSTASPVTSNSPTLSINRIGNENWGNAGGPFRLAYLHYGPNITQGSSTLYLETRERAPGSLTGFTNVVVLDRESPTFSVTSCTAGATTNCTLSTTHNIVSAGALAMTFSGATGSWTPINSTVGYTVITTGPTTINIPNLNSGGFGAFTGTVTGVVQQAQFAVNNVCQHLVTMTNNSTACQENTVVNLSGADASVVGAGAPGLMVAYNAAVQGSKKASAAYYLQGNAAGGTGFIHGLWADYNSMSPGGYVIQAGQATSAGGMWNAPNGKWGSWRNAANTADVPTLMLTTGDNTVLNSVVGHGIYFTTALGVTTIGQLDTAGNFYLPLAGGSAQVAGFVTAGKGPNYIASETGANNAIAGAISGISLAAGLRVTVKLGHTLQAGANTFNFNAGGAVSIKSSRNVANNIAVAYAATGTITLLYDGTQWVDVSQ